MTIVCNSSGHNRDGYTDLRNLSWNITYGIEDEKQKDKIQKSIDNIIDPFISKNMETVILMLRMLSDKDIVQVLAVNPELIIYIVNPSHDMQYAAIRQKFEIWECIENLSESNAKMVIEQNGGGMFDHIPKQSQTVGLIKLMFGKYKDCLNYDDIEYSLLEKPALKDIVDELKLDMLGNI